MTVHPTRLTVLATSVLAALAISACDQSPSSRNTSAVTPPRTSDYSTTAPTPANNTTSSSSMSPSTPSTATDSTSNRIASATDDAAVTTKVKAALLAEPGLRSMEIHVDTKDGVVTLTGTPDSAANRDRAVVIARNVAGVKDVVDQMASKS